MSSALKLKNSVLPTVREYFANKTVFITGGTGFVGKIVVEKLLRSCPEISKIYLLMRPTQKLDVNQRLNHMFTLPMFYRLRDKPEQLAKVQVIQGDIAIPQLVENSAERDNLLKSTDIVMHSAATVNFDEDLDVAVQMNLLAVKNITDLCKEMTKLQAIVHVSTAYSNCDRMVVQERVYKSTINPTKMLQLYHELEGSKLNALTKSLLEDHPNTYTFTKGLAERYLEDNKGDLPVSIVRPSIVMGTFQEPMPGWVDSWMGPAGISGSIGNGMLRTTDGHGNHIADFIPVDMVGNSIIAAAWKQGISGNKKIEVYNCANGGRSPISWKEFVTMVSVHTRKIPFSSAIFYPNCKHTDYKPYYWAKLYAVQILPAYLADLQRRARGKKPIVVRLQNQLWTTYKVVRHFTYHTWIFEVDNLRRLQAEMSEEDRKNFTFDAGRIDWNMYFRDYILGVRRYLLKDIDSTLSMARTNMQQLYWTYIALHFIFGLSIVSLLYCSCNDSKRKRDLDTLMQNEKIKELQH